MKTLRRLPFLIILLLVTARPSVSEEIKVGALLCLSGACADWGSAALKGAQLAASEINYAGGVLGRKISFAVEDTKEAISGASATTAFHSLLNSSDVRYFLGPTWAPGALSILPIARNRNDIIIITPSASTDAFSEAASHMFNARAREDAATRLLAHYSYERGWRRAAVFSSQQPAENRHGRLFEQEFKKQGGEVILRLEPSPDLTDLRTEALKIAAGKPDVVFLINYNQLVIGARELTALKYSGARVTVSVDESRVREAKGALEGVIVARAADPLPAFKKKFEQTFHEPPGLSADNGYDSILLLAKAIEEAGSFDVSEVKKTLATITVEGASGPIRFDERRGVGMKPVLLKATGERLSAL